MSSIFNLKREGGWVVVAIMSESWVLVRANQSGFDSMYVLIFNFCCCFCFALSTARVSCADYQRRLAVVEERSKLFGPLVIVRLRSNFVLKFRCLCDWFHYRIYGLGNCFFWGNCALFFVRVKLSVISMGI